MKNYLFAKARATNGSICVADKCRPQRMDTAHRRMRQWLAQRPPLLDQHGREVRPYMQLELVAKPRFVKLVTGQVVEYKGP